MAKIIAEPLRQQGPKYPIDTWLDGKRRRLTRGVDFTITLHSMRQYIYRAAYARDMKVSVHVTGKKTLDVQAG